MDSTKGPTATGEAGLLYLTTDLDPGLGAEAVGEFDRWAEQHARENLAFPGFRTARRLAKHSAYTGVGPAHDRLTLYRLEDLAALESRETARPRGGLPTQFEGRIRFERSLFRCLDDTPTIQDDAARGRAILHVRVDVDATYEGPFLDWYVGVHVPAVLSAEGMLGARRYIEVPRAVTARSGIEPEPLRFLTIYEMAGPDVVSRPATLVASQQGACPPELAPHRVARNRVYDELSHARSSQP